MKSILAITVTFACCLISSFSLVSAKECEVCTKVMEDVRNLLPKADQSIKEKIEEAMGAYCANKAALGPKEKKICYYIDPIKRDISQPFSLGMGSERVCKRINKQNPEICTVKYPIATEKLEVQDLSKLRVKQLKSILADRGVSCIGCVEKEEFIRKVQETEHMGNVEF